MGPLGMLASSLQTVILQGWLSAEAFDAWGWRVPFLLSAILLAISLKSRLNLHESPVFEALRQQNAVAKTPLRACLADATTRKHMALLFFCLSSGGALLFFSSQVYTGVFLKNIVGLDAQLATTLVMASTLALFPLTLYFGWLSDRIGRRPILLGGLMLGAVSIYPVFLGLQHFGNPTAPAPLAIFGLLLILVVALGAITGPQTAALPELFPARTRYSAVALPHNLAAGWIGGLSPLMATWLGVRFQDPLVGIWYPTAWLLMASVLGYFFLPEMRNRPLSD